MAQAETPECAAHIAEMLNEHVNVSSVLSDLKKAAQNEPNNRALGLAYLTVKNILKRLK